MILNTIVVKILDSYCSSFLTVFAKKKSFQEEFPRFFNLRITKEKY